MNNKKELIVKLVCACLASIWPTVPIGIYGYQAIALSIDSNIIRAGSEDDPTWIVNIFDSRLRYYHIYRLQPSGLMAGAGSLSDSEWHQLMLMLLRAANPAGSELP